MSRLYFAMKCCFGARTEVLPGYAVFPYRVPALRRFYAGIMNCEACAKLGNAYAEASHKYIKPESGYNHVLETTDAAHYQKNERDLADARIDLTIAAHELNRHRNIHPVN